MTSFLKLIFGITLAMLTMVEAQAQVKEYQPVLTAEEAKEDASLLSRETLVQEIRHIQEQLNDLRAKALTLGDMDTLQEITFLIYYGDKAVKYEDLRIVKKERDRLQKHLDHTRSYLESLAGKE